METSIFADDKTEMMADNLKDMTMDCAKPEGRVPQKEWRILFVCLGNICRSPAAEAILRALAERQGVSHRLMVDSAGTYGGHSGDLPDPRMRVAASHRGYQLTHRARQIRPADFDRFDRIIVMDDANYERVSRMAYDLEGLDKIYRMRDFARKYEISYVPDPYYEGADGFEYVLDVLEDACQGLLDDLLGSADFVK